MRTFFSQEQEGPSSTRSCSGDSRGPGTVRDATRSSATPGWSGPRLWTARLRPKTKSPVSPQTTDRTPGTSTQESAETTQV